MNKTNKIWLAALLVCGAALAATFSFSYVTGYGTNGISALFAGTTSSGQSYGRGVAISIGDSNQKAYSLVTAGPDNGSGYNGPFYIARRLSTGAIDTTFGNNGYVSAFNQSANTNYFFDRMCVDPGTGNMVLVGNANISVPGNVSTNVGVVERLLPPAAGSGTASLDTTFNPSGAGSGTAGVVFITSAANGNNSPHPHSCVVSNKGAGNSGSIIVAGDDDVYPPCTNNCGGNTPTSGLLMVAKLKSNGSMDGNFGAGGVLEVPVSDNTGAVIPEVSEITGNGNESNFPDIIVNGDAYHSASPNTTEAMVAALDRCTGVLDPNFNTTGLLVNPSISGVTYTTVGLSKIADSAGTATDLYIFYLNNGTFAGNLVDYPITGAVPNLGLGTSQTGTITFPTGFRPKGGALINSSGQVVVSGDVPASNQEALTEIGGSSAIGYTPSTTAETATCSATATPTFSPPAGTYTSTQSVTISDTTTGAKIYYTTDGSTPTTSSTLYSAAISVAATTTIKAIAAAGGFLNSAVVSAAYTIHPPAATPTFSPAPGTYTAAQNVTLSDTSAGVTIYYTTDGTTPTTGSSVYSTPIKVATTTTIKAIASGGNFSASAVASGTFTINLPAAATPAFSPAPGTYNAAQNVTISDTSAGVKIYYTTDGSTPTTSSAVYGGPINVPTTTTIKAIASGGNFSASAMASGTYTINLPAAATPAFSPAPGTYTAAQSVTLSDSSAGVTIYYTTDGSTPTIGSAKYTAPIAVSATTTIKAIAAGGNFSASPVASATYTIHLPAATPTFSPAGGAYTTVQSVAISDTSAGVTIYYTTDGSTPTTGSAVYSAPISVTTTTTIKAIASGGNFSTSPVASATYTITLPAATPTFSPAAGTYTAAQDVTISDTTPGATIYYTTDGSTPTTGSTVYSGTAINVAATATIKAIATAGGFSVSSVGSATYTIHLPAATPSFAPAGGTYTSAQSVTITDANAGVTIYYTIDGSTPTTGSTPYTGPISVNATTTIKALASGGNFSDSPVASATYTIQIAAEPTFSPAGGNYTSAQSVTISDATAGATIYYTTDGSTPTIASAVYSTPISVSATTTIKAIAVLEGYGTSPVASATYTIGSPSSGGGSFGPAALGGLAALAALRRRRRKS
ncbi:MAG: chitobiase/beta-hexosaminidase C-terminal domain-containing protein [Nevskia sp.]|nr:chitobiase/beta-hexosaminidase C-terminal domain-containing protein [Nevskia sp.]